MGLNRQLANLPDAITTDTSNNVGIGGSPSGSYKLDVTGTGRFTGNVTATATSTSAPSTGTGLYIGYGSSTSNYNGINFQGVSATDMYFGRAISSDDLVIRSSAGEKIRFTSTGAATFSSSVTANTYVEIVGDLRFNSTAADRSIYFRGSAGTPDGNWKMGNYLTPTGATVVTAAATVIDVYNGAGYGFMVRNTSSSPLLQIAGNTGAATFSSSVTATSFSNAGLQASEVFNATKSNAGYYVGYFQNTSATGLGLYIRNGLDTNSSIRISNASGTANTIELFGSGAATFSSSVQTGGNVGINIAPSVYYSLLVKGAATTSASYGGYISAGTNSSDTSFVVEPYSGASTYFKIRGDGNVGIAISSPVSLLTIATGNVTGAGQWTSSAIALYNPTNIGAYSQISFGYTTATTNASAYIGYISTNQGANGYGDIVMGTRSVTTDTQPTERMRITSGGVLQVGPNSIASGATALDAGSAYFYNNIYIGNTSGTAGYACRIDGYNNAIYLLWANALGTDQGGVALNYGSTSWSPVSSDIRTKKNFETTQGLAEVLQIEPIKYHLLSDENDAIKRLGFKAQNLQPLIPEMVYETGKKLEDGSNILTITPDYLLPVLVKAIQEQQATITSLQEQINQIVATK